MPLSCMGRNYESLEVSPCTRGSCWYSAVRGDLLGASTLALLCMGRVLVDLGLPSVCFRSCWAEDMICFNLIPF